MLGPCVPPPEILDSPVRGSRLPGDSEGKPCLRLSSKARSPKRGSMGGTTPSGPTQSFWSPLAGKGLGTFIFSSFLRWGRAWMLGVPVGRGDLEAPEGRGPGKKED